MANHSTRQSCWQGLGGQCHEAALGTPLQVSGRVCWAGELGACWRFLGRSPGRRASPALGRSRWPDGGTAWEAALSTGGLAGVLGQGEERALTARGGFSMCPPLPSPVPGCSSCVLSSDLCPGEKEPLGGPEGVAGGAPIPGGGQAANLEASWAPRRCRQEGEGGSRQRAGGWSNREGS